MWLQKLSVQKNLKINFTTNGYIFWILQFNCNIDDQFENCEKLAFIDVITAMEHLE